mgnify:CR=1 FL=1
MITGMAAPPWTELANLEHASRLSLENDDNAKRSDAEAGSSCSPPQELLGGARPKASVLDSKGKLLIAKFPSTPRRARCGRVAASASPPGARAGLSVADRVEQFRSTAHFLTRRFDRARRGEGSTTARTHAAGSERRRRCGAGASYLLAEILARAGADPRRDANELWSRILFHVPCATRTIISGITGSSDAVGLDAFRRLI